MVVSHYVVSWIQVVGLLIGLMGLFYLSLPVFRDSALKYLRPALPAMVLAILSAVGPFMVTIPGQGHDPATVISTMVVCFLGGYFIGYHSQGEGRRGYAVGGFAVLVLIIFVGVTALAGGSLSAALPSFVYDVLAALCFVGAVILPARLTKDHVQYIGVIVSVLAVLTQFIPPVLDLLNIPIK
jgi:hypothetical protein